MPSLLDTLNLPEKKADLSAEIAALKAEEAAAAPKGDPEFIAACGLVEKAGKGFPALAGEAAKAWCVWKGEDPIGPHSGMAGSGILARLTLREPTQMTQLAKELGALPAPVTAPAVPVAVLPPDAPASDPALASRAPEGETLAAWTADGPKRGRGRPKKTPVDVAVDAAKEKNEQQFAASHGETCPVGVSIVPAAEAGLTLYVNCIPSAPTECLDRYVDSLVAALTERYGAVDLRCAPADGPLGFGKWKGALAALAREAPPAGIFYILSRGRDFHEVVADALAAVAAGVVRGV